MTGRHLGDEVAAFVDGALDLTTRDRAVIHLASCADCRAAVTEQRRVKRLLAGLADPPLPPGLADRLRLVADQVPGPRVAGPGPAPRPGPAPGPAPLLNAGPGRAPARRRRRAAVAAGVGGAAVLAGVVAASVSGAAAVAVPTVTPPVQRFAVEHAAVTSRMPLSPPGLRMSQVGHAGGLAPGLAPAVGTVSWDLPGAGPSDASGRPEGESSGAPGR